MNTNLYRNALTNFKIDVFKLMNIIAFGKTMKFVKKYCNDKVLANDKRRSYLLSQPNYNITG